MRAKEGERYKREQRWYRGEGATMLMIIVATLHMNFNITVGLRQCVSLEDAISAHIFTPDQSHYLFVTKVKKYHQIHEVSLYIDIYLSQRK